MGVTVKALPQLTLTAPIVNISTVAYKWINAIVDAHKLEIGFYAIVEKENNVYTITEVVYCGNDVQESGTCEIGEDNELLIYKWLEESGRLDDASKILCWIHSHHTMSVSPSGQDERQFVELSKKCSEDYVRIIANKNRELNVSVIVYNEKMQYDGIIPNIVEIHNDKWYDDRIEEVMNIMKDKTIDNREKHRMIKLKIDDEKLSERSIAEQFGTLRKKIEAEVPMKERPGGNTNWCAGAPIIPEFNGRFYTVDGTLKNTNTTESRSKKKDELDLVEQRIRERYRRDEDGQIVCCSDLFSGNRDSASGHECATNFAKLFDASEIDELEKISNRIEELSW